MTSQICLIVSFALSCRKDYLRLRLTEEPASEMSGTAGTSWLDTGPKDCRNKIFAVTGQDMSYMLHWVGGCEQSGAVPASFREQKIG